MVEPLEAVMMGRSEALGMRAGLRWRVGVRTAGENVNAACAMRDGERLVARGTMNGTRLKEEE